MQLSQAEVIGTLNNNGVRRGYVDPGFDNGGTDQHVKTLVMEIVHHPLKLAFAHLSMTDGNARFRHQLRQPLGGFPDVFHVIIEVVYLAAAQHLTQDRLAYHQRVIFAHEGFDRQTAGGRRGDDRKIAHTAHRHIQRARNRRRGQGQDIDVGAHCLDALFVTHAKAVLFINNQETEIARKHLNTHRPVSKAIAEVIEVLLGEQGGWHQHRHLLMVFDRQESGAHRHFRFAEANIAAHQTVHRQRLAHIAQDGVNSLRLVGRGLEREAVAK